MSGVNHKDRKALERFNQYVQMVQAATAEQSFETDKEKEARIKGLLNNEVAFAKYYFPHYCASDFAPFHKRFFRAVINNNRCFVVRQWARAHAKSVNTIIATLFLVFNGESKTVLWTSYTYDNAKELLKPIQTELERNPRIINDFGTQIKYGDWEEGKFITSGGVSFRAIGMGQSPRGTRNQEVRPDLIVGDDVDNDEVVRNPKRLNDAWEWFMTALYGSFDIKGNARLIIVNNRIAKDCIVERAAKVAGADFERINLLDKNGQPSWRERFSLEECKEMINKMGYRFAQKEYFNNPITSGTVFKEEHIQYKKMPNLNAYKVLAMYTDPSFKHTAKSDYKASAFIGLYKDEWHIIKVYCDRVSVRQMWEWHYEVYDLCKAAGVVVHMAMESNFIQGLHFAELDKMAQETYPIPIKGDTRKKPDKFQRIESMSPAFDRGKVFFNLAEKSNPHQQRGVEHLLLIEKGSRSPDDFPDALESAMFYARQKITTGNTPYTLGKRSTRKNRY